jgi:hypothetical protein
MRERDMKTTNAFVLVFILSACGHPPSKVPVVHRPTAPVCTSTTRPVYNCGQHITPQPPNVMCSLDSDCQTGADGRCTGNAHDGCTCTYDTCTSDADCAAGQLCDCRSTWRYGANGPNVCLTSNCRVDADCGAGGYCSPSLDPGCGAYLGVTGWYCHTADDSCVNDSDCQGLDGGFGTPFCGYHPEVGHWVCSVGQCVG